MNIDKERLENYLIDIKKRNIEIEDLLKEYTDKQIVSDDWCKCQVLFPLVR